MPPEENAGSAAQPRVVIDATAEQDLGAGADVGRMVEVSGYGR